MTVYYVLNQLGPHSKGDVLSFSPEQIGAGVDISHLTTIGAIRVASGGEIALAVPAQIQATHAPQGVGVFTNNGVPDGASYAGIAAYGSLCWDVAVSPPTIYVNTGTIAVPVWAAAGYTSLPGLTSDGQNGASITGAFQVGATLAVTGAAILSDALTVTGVTTLTGPASFDSSISAVNASVPAAAAGTNAGTTPPAPALGVGANDTAGSLTFGTGTSPALGAQVVLTFGTPYTTAPKAVIVTPTNAAAAAKGPFYATATTTTLTLGMAVAGAASQANTVYGLSYTVLE